MIRNKNLTCIQKLFLATGSSLIAITNPQRGDMIAVLGEVTISERHLHKMYAEMTKTKSGRAILKDKPRVNSASIDLGILKCLPSNSFGKHYANFLERYSLSPDSRAKVFLINNPKLAYLIQRYREIHDFWHVLTGLPITNFGEICQKWFEQHQTGIPMTAISGIAGPLRLSWEQKFFIYSTVIPQARKCNKKYLLSVYYEKMFELDINELRNDLGITKLDI